MTPVDLFFAAGVVGVLAWYFWPRRPAPVPLLFERVAWSAVCDVCLSSKTYIGDYVAALEHFERIGWFDEMCPDCRRFQASQDKAAAAEATATQAEEL